MDSLEHRVTLADVCAAGCADAALELSCLVGDDVAVEVRENEDFEVAAALLVDELCVVMSMYHSSVTMSGYSSPTFLQRLRNLRPWS